MTDLSTDQEAARRDTVTRQNVGTLEGYRLTFTASMLAADLRQSMKQAGAPAVVLEDGGQVYGILIASQLDSFMSSPFGRELVARRPVRNVPDLVDVDPLIIEADQPITLAIETALGRGERSYDPILVRERSGSLVVMKIDTLLRAQARILDAANREKDALIEQISRSESALRQTLSRLRETQDRLVQSEKMASLGQLVAGVAHEINTPIGVALTAASHFGEKTGALTEAFENNSLTRNVMQRYITVARETAEIIAYNIGRAAQLIQSFKQVAIDQTSELPRSFDLAEFLQQLIRSLDPNIRKAGHSIVIECQQGIVMNSFPGALGQVITNLVNNAVVHAYDPGAPGVITIRDEMLPDDHVGVVVADAGRGMTPEVQAKIYDPFFTTRRGSGGAGLGLHIVYNLVTERLGGTIHCDSSVGQGSRFSLRIPRTVAKG